MAAPQKRGNPFARTGSGPQALAASRPKSLSGPSPLWSSNQGPAAHGRHQSVSNSDNPNLIPVANMSLPNRPRRTSKGNSTVSNTFAPSFIKSEESRRGSEVVKGIEGENDFSGKRYVWLKDPQTAFVKGWIVEDRENNQVLVQCEDGSVRNPSSEHMVRQY